MATTVNHLFDGQILGQDVAIDEARNDSYSESTGSCSYRKSYHLQTPTGITIATARLLFSTFLKAAGRLRYNGFPIKSFNISHNEEEDLDRFFEIELEYEGTVEEDTDFEQYKIPYELNETFETGGGTVHTTQAWFTDSNNTGETVYPVDEEDPGPSSFGGVIGWNGESAEGVDVIRPAFSFTLHKKVPAAEMTTEYRQLLCLTTGCVNDDTYCGFSAGNLLLESVSGSSSAEYKEEDIQIEEDNISWPPRVYYDLTFKFRGGLSFDDLSVAGITVSKKAHQYLWIYYEKEDDTAVGVTLDRPKSVIVNDVYPSADFTLLNIYGEQDQ